MNIFEIEEKERLLGCCLLQIKLLGVFVSKVGDYGP